MIQLLLTKSTESPDNDKAAHDDRIHPGATA